MCLTLIYQYAGASTGIFTNGKKYVVLSIDSSAAFFWGDNGKLAQDSVGNLEDTTLWTPVLVIGLTQLYP